MYVIFSFSLNINDQQALNIHGCDDNYISESEESGKSEFDEEYYSNKPPPLSINPCQIISINVLSSSDNKYKGTASDDFNHKKEDTFWDAVFNLCCCCF